MGEFAKSWGGGGPIAFRKVPDCVPDLVGIPFFWEVLNRVGVDGVGGIFPFFSSLFLFFVGFSSFFSDSPRGQGQTTAIYCKHGEFHSDPVCTDPV